MLNRVRAVYVISLLRLLVLPLAYSVMVPAVAQSTLSAGTPNSIISPAETGNQLPPEHVFGDDIALRQWLGQQGVSYDLSYESETASVINGGVRRGTAYAHSISLKNDFDLEQSANITGLSLHDVFVNRVGHNASAEYLHEYLTEVQELYGSGGGVVAHLVYLYAEEKALKGALNAEIGRLDVGQDFATSPLYCEFMTLSVCPTPRAISIQTGFSIFPSSTWGLRLKIEPITGVALQLGGYQVRPAYGGNSGFNWSASGTTGAMIPVEIDWTPLIDPERRPGHYKVGVTYDSSRYPELGGLQPNSPGTSTPMHAGREGWYALADQMLVRTGPNGTDGVIVLGGYARMDSITSTINELEFLGFLAKGLIPARPADTVGMQVVRFRVSRNLEATQWAELRIAAPLSSGLSGAPAAVGVQNMELMIEARYDLRLFRGVRLMPDIQYVIHPDATARIRNGTVMGLRVTLDF